MAVLLRFMSEGDCEGVVSTFTVAASAARNRRDRLNARLGRSCTRRVGCFEILRDWVDDVRRELRVNAVIII